MGAGVARERHTRVPEEAEVRGRFKELERGGGGGSSTKQRQEKMGKTGVIHSKPEENVEMLVKPRRRGMKHQSGSMETGNMRLLVHRYRILVNVSMQTQREAGGHR